MKRWLIRIGVLLLVFAAGVLLFSVFMYKKEAVKAEEMPSSTLPVMYMEYEGMPINPMTGYKNTVEEASFRDTITLLPADRSLTMLIENDGAVEGIVYTISSLADGSLIENGKIKNLTDNGSTLRADFSLANPLLMDQEYGLRFDVSMRDGSIVSYYTRVMQRGMMDIKGYLDYANSFYQNCLNQALTDTEMRALETDSASGNSSFHSVDIHSSLKQITWESLKPELVYLAVPKIKEVNGSTISLVLDYVIQATNDDGEKEFFTVSDFYRMRTKQGQIVLLDFERSATEIFDSERNVLTEDGLNLGVVGADVQYKTNQGADIVAFVSNGELWSYNRSTNKIAEIFSFRSEDMTDYGTVYPEHQIKISTVQESGDVTFSVYGHMMGGDHEGQLGIGIYQYHADLNMTTEKIFIAENEGVEYMNQTMSKLSYVSSTGYYYFSLGGSLYQVNLTDGTWAVLKDRIKQNCFFVSESQQTVAWMDEMESNNSYNITILSLETGENMHIEAAEGEKIKALCFSQENLLYGYAKDADIVTDVTGNTLFPMYKVCIQPLGGNVLKEYQLDGVYVTQVTEKEGLLEITRVEKQGEGYAYIASDHMVYNLSAERATVNPSLSVDERKGTQVELTFSTSQPERTCLSVRGRFEVVEEPLSMAFSFQLPENIYFVYGFGGLQEVNEEVNKAIWSADENVGSVLNEKQEYVWERGTNSSTASIPPENVPAGILEAPIDEPTLTGILGKDHTILNLTGCTLSQIYYQIDHGYPVIGRLSDGSNALILGYDIYNIWIYSRDTGTTYAMATDDAEIAFSIFGNVFVSYR